MASDVSRELHGPQEPCDELATPVASGDIRAIDFGSVWGFIPLNNDAKHFFRVALETESWQWIGPMLCVDRRPALALRERLVDEGFSLL